MELFEVLKCYDKYGSKFSLLLFTANVETYPLGFQSPGIGCKSQTLFVEVGFVTRFGSFCKCPRNLSCLFHRYDNFRVCRHGLQRLSIAKRYTHLVVLTSQLRDSLRYEGVKN